MRTGIPLPRILPLLLFLGFAFISPFAVTAQENGFRLGIIGLDTSHAVAFTQQINDPANRYGCRVVAAFPGGSPDIPESVNRMGEYVKKLRDDFHVEMVNSVEELCGKVDGILLESVDGRPHLTQVKPVFAAGKPVFIDKPAAGSLRDVIEIFRLAREANVPCWSASSLRFSEGIAGARHDPRFGAILGCDAFSPCALEPHHPDLFWYGIHGVETLFTIMGSGCGTVRRVQSGDYEHVVGIWNDGRIGTFRGLRAGKHDYGAYVYGINGVTPSGGYTGFAPLVEEIVKFFGTGIAPVSPEETIEIYAFMAAADESKAKGGAPVSLKEVIAKAERAR
ncbi:MAG TPA: Gfo/Idh/MocA family oxidoreductase [Armatimonadota bacterium]|nr:Gfo/Idh/MocA family oxidoreductase [Armatimonadota bacterium]